MTSAVFVCFLASENSKNASIIFRATVAIVTQMNTRKSRVIVFMVPWTSMVIVVKPRFASSSSRPRLTVTTVKKSVTPLMAIEDNRKRTEEGSTNPFTRVNAAMTPPITAISLVNWTMSIPNSATMSTYSGGIRLGA